jgi:DNA uptake protein ComE-like DNA-binding protein
LLVGGASISIDWSSAKHFYVVLNQDANASLGNISTTDADIKASTFTFDSNTDVNLQRLVPGGGYIIVDSKQVPVASGSWLADDNQPHSVQRDISKYKCIRRLWASAAEVNTPTLGANNSYFGGDPNIQAHPANKNFTNIGEIGMIFVKSAYSQGPNPIGPNDTEATVRINLADPNFQQVFKYLTVFDPAVYSWNDPNETRIKGRININTAPWYVLAQLPWVSQRKTFSTYELAKEIVGYRDDINGFESIGQLCQVGIYDSNDYRSIDYYARGSSGDLDDYPDLSAGDGAIDDFEERDLIFARISNLVTVRSDVFTAYILVRIGTDGPQKRVIAIFDRSDVHSPTDKVKIVAVQPVADPR